MTKQELDSRLAHVPLYTESLIIREGAKMQPIRFFMQGAAASTSICRLDPQPNGLLSNAVSHRPSRLAQA